MIFFEKPTQLYLQALVTHKNKKSEICIGQLYYQWVLFGILHGATEARALLLSFKARRSIGHKQTISDSARLDIANLNQPGH